MKKIILLRLRSIFPYFPYKMCMHLFKVWIVFVAALTLVTLLLLYQFSPPWSPTPRQEEEIFAPKPLQKNSAITLKEEDANESQSSFDHMNEVDDREEQVCKIPRLTPTGQNAVYYDSVLQFMEPSCIQEATWVLFAIDLDSNLVRLRKNDSIWTTGITCFYRRVDREASLPDYMMRHGMDEPYPLSSERIRIPADYENIFVWCRDNQTGLQIYTDMLTQTQLRPDIASRLENIKMASSSNPSIKEEEEGFSIQVIGLDSSSHMNFVRNLPLSHAYLLDQMSAIEFHGFNSVDAGTLWTTFGLFSGRRLSQLRTTCWKQDMDYLDECPFIWKELAERGYITGFAEDSPIASMFNMDSQRGFSKKTFDYDFRPYSLMNQYLLHPFAKNNTDDLVCYGPKLTLQILLDIALKMAHNFHGQRYWHFSWSSPLTHTANVLSRYADKPLLKTLQQFKNRQLLNNTVLIVMSDHGMRYGLFRQSTEQGLLEERLPILYFVLPEKFRKKYPTAVKNMEINSNRLTAAYDLYHTMRDLMTPKELEERRLAERTKEQQQHRQKNLDPQISDDTPEAVSLFLPVSKKRTCGSLKISLGYCICLTDKVDVPISGNLDVDQAVATAVFKMNENLRPFPQCAVLTLDKIVGAKTLQADASVAGEMERFHLTKEEAGRRKGIFYEIVFDTRPGGGRFSAIVLKAGVTNGQEIYYEMTELHRISAYGKDGRCISNKEIRIYCHCHASPVV